MTSRPQLAELSGRQFHEKFVYIYIEFIELNKQKKNIVQVYTSIYTKAEKFLEDELKYFFPRFYWDVCLFTMVKPIIMEGVWFHFAMTLNNILFPICVLVFQCRYLTSMPLLCTLTKN